MPPRLNLAPLQLAPAAEDELMDSTQPEEPKSHDEGNAYNKRSGLTAGTMGTMGSLRMNQDGITVLTNSYNPWNFNADGMSKHDGQHYKISERDMRLISRLGAGASSTVFKGFLIRDNKFVAVKKINVFERDTRHQMLNDVKALCDASTEPGLIAFYGAYHLADSGQIAIILEYMDGGSLGDLATKAGRIPENILSQISAKILGGLSYLHHTKHMVHRDIKPANILLNLQGEAKITDFGLSAFINSTLAVCKTYLGTVTYMSPERINNEQYSFAADVWSLGLSLLECATGKYPYDASGGPLPLMLQVLSEDVPMPEGQFSEEFRDFVLQCMAKDPADRPTAEALSRHPFITKHAREPQAQLRSYMQQMLDPLGKLEEIAVVFAWNYYALLSTGPERLKDLAPLYADTSVLAHDNEQFVGRQKIIEKLKTVAQMHAGFRVTHQVTEVDCQPLGRDSALVHVHGMLQTPSVAGQEDARGACFAECFLLSQINPGEYYVANQAFRLLS